MPYTKEVAAEQGAQPDIKDKQRKDYLEKGGEGQGDIDYQPSADDSGVYNPLTMIRHTFTWSNIITHAYSRHLASVEDSLIMNSPGVLAATDQLAILIKVI